ncbi:MAG: hypothetical protein ABMB14_38505, partial [Myxococcota bacterium]
MNREIVTLGIRLFHVGWMVIGLGIALELLVLGVIVAGGGDPTVGGFAVAVFTRVSWSMVVCAALAVTTALPRAAIPASGIAGLLVAPAATVTVKVIQRMTSQALAGHAASIWLPAVAALSVIKGVEYLWLGAALAWLGGRGYGIVAAWAVGGITGVVGAAAV